jgi:hypothetical protein
MHDQSTQDHLTQDGKATALAMTDAVLTRLADRLADELEARGLVLPAGRAAPAESPVEAREQALGLATPKQIATDLGISRRTVHRRINEWDLVRRDAEGYPKEAEGGTTYISQAAWQKRGSLATQTVRRLAGLTN